jgi:hypothetical protein
MKYNKLSTTALVISLLVPLVIFFEWGKSDSAAIIGWIFWLFVPIISIVLALKALYQIKRSHEKGKWVAILAIIVSVLPWLFFVYLFFAISANLQQW